jgi:hypothetical protein
MSRSFDDYRREVRQSALLSGSNNMAQAYEHLVDECAWHRYVSDLDKQWDDQRYREALAKSAYMEGADGHLARRDKAPIERESIHG